MDAAADLGRNPVSTGFSLSMEMSRLARDGTAEPISRDQFLRRERRREIFIFPVQLTTSRIGNLTRLILLLLYVMTIHTYIHTYACAPTTTTRPYVTTSVCVRFRFLFIFLGNSLFSQYFVIYNHECTVVSFLPDGVFPTLTAVCV